MAGWLPRHFEHCLAPGIDEARKIWMLHLLHDLRKVICIHGQKTSPKESAVILLLLAYCFSPTAAILTLVTIGDGILATDN